jgi:hypothetical protein
MLKCTVCCGRIFKEILRNRFSLTWVFWPEVLSLLCMASIVQMFEHVMSLTWDLFSVSITCISFFWPIAVSDLCCDTLRKMSLDRGRQPEAKTQVEGPQVKYICIKGPKKSHLRNETKTATQCCWGGWGGTLVLSWSQGADPPSPF